MVIPAIMDSSSVRLATRSAFVLNFEFLDRSGRPRPAHRMEKSRSLPPPRRMDESDVGKARYGTMEAVFCGIKGFFFFFFFFGKGVKGASGLVSQ